MPGLSNAGGSLVRCICSGLLVLGCLCLLVTRASAAVVTLGSPLTAEFEPRPCNPVESCTATIARYPESGARVTSPSDGVIVRWRMLQASSEFKYKLRVLAPAGGSAYTGAGTSGPVTPAGAGTETFPTSLPIRAGQAIGIDVEANAPIGFARENGGVGLGWKPFLAEGATAAGSSFNGELAFNADVQPVPTIASLAPKAGSFKGGATVTITGTDFEGTSAISFGGVPAPRFTLDSEGQVTAVAPALKALSKVPVTLTTNAGSATSSALYEVAACVVPKLKGKMLKTARKKLKHANCKLGKAKGSKSKGARVAKQKPKPGRRLAPGGKVNVTLG